MSFPVPKPGLVIRYGFLWSHERDAGADEAGKDRPCAIIVAAKHQSLGVSVVVAAITHRPPDDPADSMAIPAAVCGSLGLDGGHHWFRVDELNRFTWPGYDLRPIPGRSGEYAYGMLPPALFERLRTRILDRQRLKRARMQSRD